MEPIGHAHLGQLGSGWDAHAHMQDATVCGSSSRDARVALGLIRLFSLRFDIHHIATAFDAQKLARG